MPRALEEGQEVLGDDATSRTLETPIALAMATLVAGKSSRRAA